MKRITYILFIYCILLLFSFNLNVIGAIQDESINALQTKLQNLQESIQKAQESIKNTCPTNSYLKNGLCYCNEGLVWNEKSTECITYNQACQSKYGSNTYGDKNYCYCTEGYVWNKNRTKCITHTEDCCLKYGNYVIGRKGDKKYASYCDCEEGYVWNKEKTKCITPTEWCLIEYNNDERIKAYKEGTEYKCKCIDGYVWRNELNKCVTYTEDCQLKYGNHVIGKKGDEKYASYCDCEEGYGWNLNKTECIPKFEVFIEYFSQKNTILLLVAILLGLIPILIWFFVLSIAIKKVFKKSISLKRFFTFFGFGILITPLVWYGEGLYLKLLKVNLNVSLSVFNIILVYGGIAVVEELAKFFSTSFILKRNKYFDEAIDAMIYLIVLALGFGLVENILAVNQEIVAGSLLLPILQNMGLRFIGANLIHLLASGFIGYFWALSLLKKKKSYLYWGLILGIVLHFFFNLVIIKFGGTAVFLVSLALIALLILFLNDFKKLSNLLQKSSS